MSSDMLFKAIISGIDNERRLILEDIYSLEQGFFRDHCWVNNISSKELAKAQVIIDKYGFHNSEPIYFHADVYKYYNKQGLKNLTKLTHEDQLMFNPTSFKVSRRTSSVYFKLMYPKVTDAVKAHINSLALNAINIDIGSDHITCRWDFDSVEDATAVKSQASLLTDYESVIICLCLTDTTTDSVEPAPTKQTVDVHIKFPKCSRVFNNYQDIKSIATDSGIITRDAFMLNNSEQSAVKLTNPIRYLVQGITIPSNFVREVEHKLEAKFDCTYLTEEFLRIEDSCIVISRNGETILLSNELMALHDQTAEILKHDDMYFLPEDTEYTNPISKQLLTIKKVTNKL